MKWLLHPGQSGVKKLTKAVIKCVSKAIRAEAEGGGLSAKILCEVDKLPQLELYPNRRRFLEIVQTECMSEFENLINNLCQKYSDMLLTCHGKDSYMKLQVQWHDYIRSLAAFVYAQSDTDAQVIPNSDGEYDASTSPVANVWLSLVLSANSHVNVEKDTQFSMLHAFARSVYLHEHGKALAIANPATDPCETQTSPESDNNMSSLIRMCGSQLRRILAVKEKESEKANRRATGSKKAKYLDEQVQLFHSMCMSHDDKDINKSLLPTCDEGGMVFPHSKLFDFLRQFDSAVRQEIKYSVLETHGDNAFLIIEEKMNTHKDKLYPVFATNFPTFSKHVTRDSYNLLFDKMLNLRKKDMERSWERQKGTSVTLNLRDELKPCASKKEQ